MRTPWGQSDYMQTYAEGITFYGTPSHGGFHLSPARIAEMPAPLRGLDGYPQSWYEEDCAWAAVCYAFPQAFVGDQPGRFPTVDAARDHARGVLERWYPDELGRLA